MPSRVIILKIVPEQYTDQVLTYDFNGAAQWQQNGTFAQGSLVSFVISLVI